MVLLSFVIPCYGSQKTISHVVRDIVNKVAEREDFDYEIITVNDYSPDNVYEVLRELASADKKVKVLNLARNFGKHSALMAGLSVVSGDIVVTLDDDGQCPVERLWDMVDPIVENECDIALAKYEKKMESFLKRSGSRLNSFMSRTLIGKPKDLVFENYYAIRRFIVDEIIRYKNPYPYMEGLLLRSSSRIKNVEMVEHNRIEGKGNFGLLKSLSLWVNGFTAFSVKPLRIASFIGFLCASAGFIYGLVIIIRKLFFNGIAIMGYSSLLAVILFIGGLLMIMLGLIGEYIGRIYISINNSPQYVISEYINLGDGDE